MKKTIKLNESKLRSMVMESIQKVLNENFVDWDALEQDGYLDDMSKLDRLQDPDVMSQYASFDDDEDETAEINEYDIQMDKLVREYKAKIDTLPKAQGYRSDECNTWVSGTVVMADTNDNDIAAHFNVGTPVTLRIGFPAIDYPESQDGILYYDFGMQNGKVDADSYEIDIFIHNDKTGYGMRDFLVTHVDSFNENTKEIACYAGFDKTPAVVVRFDNAQQQQPIGGLQESKLRAIIKEGIKKVLNEEYGVDIQDTLAWVQRKHPDMSPEEQERFARNIIKKREHDNYVFDMHMATSGGNDSFKRELTWDEAKRCYMKYGRYIDEISYKDKRYGPYAEWNEFNPKAFFDEE